MESVLEVKNLHTYFDTDTGISLAVEGACFDIRRGQTVAVVGESGCGKTITALSIMRLVPVPGRVVQGEIRFQGQDILSFSPRQMRSVRGRQIGMVFQEPMSSLNPLYSIGYQITETILAHKKPGIRMKKSQARQKVVELLNRVEIPSADERYNDYPHNLSGGLRQRAMIAQALACEPDLLIADEPTTALDVTIQAQILELFLRLKKTTQMSIMLITHDLGIVAQIADRVCIMYAGKIVEDASVLDIFAHAKHPYTQGLLESIPARHVRKDREVGNGRDRLSAIPGAVPHPENKPQGCPFHPRCALADNRCRNEAPALLEIEAAHKVSCWKAK